MNLFQPPSLKHTNGIAVHGLLGTASPSPAQLPATGVAPISAAPQPAAPQPLNVFGGGSAQQSWGGSLFSRDPAWSAVSQPVIAEPAAPAPVTPNIAPVPAPDSAQPAAQPAVQTSDNGWADYLSSNPDVKAAFDADSLGMTADQFAKAHYQKFGQAESRALPPAAKLEMLTSDRELTPQQLAEQLGSDPQLSAVTAKLPELEQKWLSGPIKLNDKNTGTNVLAAENLYQQIGGVREAVKQNNGGKEFWSGEGHGSLEKNQMAFTRALMEKGVTDLRQLSVREEPVMETGTFRPDGKGGWLQEVRVPATFGEVGDFETRMQPVRDAALVEKLNAAKPAEGETPKWMQIGKNRAEPASSTVSMEYDTGKKSQSLVNKETGEEIHTTPRGDNTFRIAYTTRGEGMVHWNVKMVPTTDPASGAKSYIPIPVQQYEDTSDMGIISPILTVASFIPGVAPFAMGINAALAASTGNWTGAILSAAGAYGSYLGNANAALNAAGPPTAANAATIANNASTISNIKTGVGLVNTVNALNKGDALGAIGAGAGTAANAGLAGDSSGVLRNVAQGVGAIRTAQKLQSGLNGGNPLQIAGAVSGLFATARAY